MDDELELTLQAQRGSTDRLRAFTERTTEFVPDEWKELARRWEKLVAVQRARLSDGEDAIVPPLRAAFIGKPGRGQDAAILALAHLLGTAGNLKGEVTDKTDLLEPVSVLLGGLPELTNYSAIWARAAAPARMVEESGFSASPGFRGGFHRLLVVDVDRRLEVLSTASDTGVDRGREVDSRWNAGLQTLKALVREPWIEPAILLVGDTDLDRLLKENKDLEASFEANTVRFEPLTVEQAMEVSTKRLESKGYRLSDETSTKLEEGLARMPGELNYRSIGNLVVTIASNHSFRIQEPAEDDESVSGLYELEPGDVPLDEGALNKEEVLERLGGLVGLGPVKEELTRLVELAEARAQRHGEGSNPGRLERNYHFIFRGPPGTGKTTVARLMGDLFYAAGLLSKGHLIERDRAGLVGRYLGQSEINLAEAVDEARGGVLFIDEAYALGRKDDADSPDEYGQAIIDALVQRLYEFPGSFSCVIAGYGEEMREFLETNQGLASRFNHELVFPSFSAAELAGVCLGRIDEQNMKVADAKSTGPVLEAAMTRLVSATNPETFGNARAAIEIADRAVESALIEGREEVESTHLEEAVERAIETEIARSSGSKGVSAKGPASQESIKKALGLLEGLGASPSANRDGVEMLIDSFRNEEPRAGFVNGLPRAVADFYFSTDDSNEEELLEMAGALLSLYREVGLLESTEITVLEPDKWPVSEKPGLLDQLFEQVSGGGAIFIPDISETLGPDEEGEGAGAARDLLVTNLIDLIHRTRYDLAIFMGVPERMMDTDPAVIRLLGEFEYRL